MISSRSRSFASWRLLLVSAVMAVAATLLPIQGASAATAPGVIRNLQLQLYTSGVSVTWDAPTSDGGSAITDYVIERAPTNTGPWTVIPDGVGAWTNTSVGSLVAGQTYWLRITAVNAIGPGTPCTPVSFVFGSVPAKPTNLHVTAGADLTFTLTWEADLNNFGDTIVDFVIEQAPSAGGPWTVINDGVSAQTWVIFGGLTAGQTYWYRVKGVSGQATGQPSDAASGKAIIKPLTVTNVTAIALDSDSVQLTWDEDELGGTAPVVDRWILMSTNLAGPYSYTPYSYVSDPTVVTIDSLTPRTPYFFKIQAANNAGVSPDSDPVSATPGYSPEAPQQLSVTPGNGRLVVSWLPPIDDGGNPLGGYQISYALAGSGSWTDLVVLASVHTATINGLLNGTAYDVKVVAMNQIGMGPAATASGTPRAVPSRPLSLTGVAKSRAVALSWLLPSDLGGAVVVNYVVQRATSKTGPWRTVTHPVSTARKLTVKNLTPGKRYFFRVAAVNAAGRGAWSTVISVVPKH